MVMRRLGVLFVLLATALALAAAPAIAQEPTIKPGVGSAGIDLSGLTVAQAAAKLDAELAPRLQGDLVLGAAGRPWTLKMADAGLKLDSVRTAKRALYAKVVAQQPVQVPAALTHSRIAVRSFVEGVAKGVYEAPRDATVRITLRKLYSTHSRRGHALPVAATRTAVDAALDDVAAPRVLHQKLVTVGPKVTAADARRIYGTVITIDRNHFTLRLFKNLKLAKSYGIAVGMAGLSTPAGQYSIQNKQVDPAWHVPNSAWAGSLAGQVIPGGAPNNPLKARWLGIANGVGIHGTAEDWSIGSRASHGCIRMHVADVKALYPRVPVGTPVLIV
jgi:lipoprotein-anchoring transpeptidase ErfK/SrfK